MGKKIFAICCLLVLWVVAIVTETYAHGGHSKPKAEETIVEDTTPAAPAEDVGNFYSIGNGETDSPPSPLSRTGLLPGGMEQDGMEMPAGTMEHEEMKHAQPQVKLAHHELVSPSQKGYKAAAGITVLAGVFFAMLGIKRKKED